MRERDGAGATYGMLFRAMAQVHDHRTAAPRAGMDGTRSPRGQVIDVLAVDPDLGTGLTAQEHALITHAARVRALPLDPGPIAAFPTLIASEGALGLLVVSGVISRTINYDDRDFTELVGEGDLLRPWQEHEPDLPGVTVHWQALSPCLLAVLDARFAHATARFSALHQELLARSVRRGRWLSFQALIRGYPSVDDRVLLLYRFMAQRWGKVTPEGVRITVPLTHAMISTLIGTRRPAVTSSLGRLAARGVIARDGRGVMLLDRSAAA